MLQKAEKPLNISGPNFFHAVKKARKGSWGSSELAFLFFMRETRTLLTHWLRRHNTGLWQKRVWHPCLPIPVICLFFFLRKASRFGSEISLPLDSERGENTYLFITEHSTRFSGGICNTSINLGTVPDAEPTAVTEAGPRWARALEQLVRRSHLNE